MKHQTQIRHILKILLHIWVPDAIAVLRTVPVLLSLIYVINGSNSRFYTGYFTLGYIS